MVSAVAEAAGVGVPALGLGTGELRGAACYEAVRHGLELGYRHVDTAEFYGNEEEVGRALRDSAVPREHVFLTTKVWRTHLAAGQVAAAVQGSLRRLGTDYVDLLLVHWPAGGVPLEETMAAMAAAREAGRTRHVGVSNFTPSQVREAAGHVPLLCNQVEYHPLLAQDDLLALAEDLDMLVTAYSPTAQGAVASEPLLARVGAAHGRSPVQIALRWLVQQRRVAAIPRSADPAHRAANLAVFDFALSDDEMAAITDLARSRRLRLSDPQFAPDWTN